jgi:DNA-directed RNA polymerase subunit RPC12/RpoP
MPDTVSRCARCEAIIPQSPDTPAGERMPCPECGSKTRIFEGAASLAVGVNVTVVAAAAIATASTEGPAVNIEKPLPLETAGFDLQWLRLSDDGAWMVQVYNRQRTLVDCAINDDPEDAFLAVVERLLP